MDERGIYQDLLRKFVREKHSVTIVTPIERRKGIETNIRHFERNTILQVKTFNIQKTNIIEKGIGTLAIEGQYLNAIKRYLSDTKFDLVLYSTPPITFSKVISFIKKRDNAASYLLLKDIFPQNAVDIGLMKENSFIHRYFRKKEQKLYGLSDYIGCMSPANVDYVLAHNREILANRVEVCPNSIEPDTNEFEKEDAWREQYNIPKEATVFIYGGNLGKPQGLGFLTEVLEANSGKQDRFFLVVGSGTEKPRLIEWFSKHPQDNAIMLEALPKLEYDKLVRSCDVGLIFLDRSFTIPNYPSRLLSYMEYKMPVIVASDIHTDIGTIAETNGYGLWSEHGDLEAFNAQLDKLVGNTPLIKEMGEKGYEYMMKQYTVENSYNIIMKKLNSKNNLGTI